MYHSQQEPSLLRFATYLSPSLYEVYEYISKYIGEQTGHPTQIEVGHSLDEFTNGQVHIGFVCGLPYYLAARRDDPPIELLAAPVLYLKRYQGKPCYFSDIVVRRDSPFASFQHSTRGSLQKCIRRIETKLQHALMGMHHDLRAAEALRQGLIAKFVPVTNDHYLPIHEMFKLVEAWATNTPEKAASIR